MKDGYVPKPSKLTRLKKEFWYADDDTWIEIGVFTGKIDKHTCEPVLRPLFYSQRTQLGYWDEPPTGASRVLRTEPGQKKLQRERAKQPMLSKRKRPRSRTTTTAKSKLSAIAEDAPRKTPKSQSKPGPVFINRDGVSFFEI